MIENVVSGSLYGRVETSIKANTKKTNVMVTEKCIGQTEVVIRENG